MVQSYDALGMTSMRDDARRVLQASYPKGDFVTKGSRQAVAPWWKLW